LTQKKITVRINPYGKTLTVPEQTTLKDVLSEFGVEFPCGGKGTCGGCRVRVIEGTIRKDHSHQVLLEELDLEEPYRLACKSILTHDVTLEIAQFQHIILTDNTPFEFKPLDGFGVAFDLGTSTLACQLIDLQTGQVVDVETRMNPQMTHGADLVTRMAYAIQSEGGVQLRDLVRSAFKDMIEHMVNRNGVIMNRIHLVGNTVMHHLFGGLDLTPLSAYPFKTPYCSALKYNPKDLGLSFQSSVPITFLPPMGSFVGSDILAGLIAIRVLNQKKPVALIDLGTNGEIAIAYRNRIVYASTAAGPAFEGTNITCGMRAASGAISSIELMPKGFECHVIGNAPAMGICGSGLIDFVAALLESGKMDPGGQLSVRSNRIDLTDNVYLTQKDIREFQLAKGAIATGLEILSNRLDLAPRELEKIYIAGAFGNFINLNNTRKIGLLDYPDNKIQRMGNSALLGAKMSLFGKDNETSEILARSEHVALETHPAFMDIFARNMLFNQNN